MASGKVQTEGVLLFEQPFVKVPFENYRKVFRSSQRSVEKDFGGLQALSKQATSSSGQDALASIDAMMGRIQALKRKLSDVQGTAGSLTQTVMKDRLQHIGIVENLELTEDPRYARWEETRLDRWLVDWLLRYGKEKTAIDIAQERGIESLVDIELFMEIKRIEDALRNHSCSGALAWCNENKAALRKAKSTLEFDLRLQEFIELARARKRSEAIMYSRKYLHSWQDTHLSQITQAAALLAIPPTTTCPPYKRLYDVGRWDELVRKLRLTTFSLNSLPPEPLLHLALYAGLSSLKLRTCYDHASKNVDCPVCDPSLGSLAQEVPYSHHVNSTIVCRISGKIMNENNPPMAFPGGYAYSREALVEMAARNDGQVICPRSGERCDFSSLKKVFVS
ncbi:hypothetical protein PENSPDRAFT_676621 [Peniophora sp. CONT]|nr:hypothetical protein PENSPDRAFT_676621 [Peniophora sp. CONT]